MQVKSLLLLVALVGLILVGCADKQSTPAPAMTTAMAKGPSLYDRLGKKEAITAVVNDFVTRVAADNRINQFFAQSNIDSLKVQLVNQICQASGGPCQYTGQDMKTVHQGMGISNAHFNALVEDLVATLNTFKVPTPEQNELLALLGPMRQDIVEKL
jgi:hemoglobin